MTQPPSTGHGDAIGEPDSNSFTPPQLITIALCTTKGREVSTQH